MQSSKSKLKFRPHINILRQVSEMNFNCGKKLIADILTGKKTSQVKRLNLHKKILFSSLALYDQSDVIELINLLVHKGYLKYEKERNTYFKTLRLTDKGKEELVNPHDTDELKNSLSIEYDIEKVTSTDLKTFAELGDILGMLSDEQKKAVIHAGKYVLCIAGAGTGKTNVLTKRVHFLSQYRDVAQEKILAVTFTRKAKAEMKERLEGLVPNNSYVIETFNSFCEKILRKNAREIYGKEIKVMDFRTKKDILFKAIKESGYSAADAIDMYYAKKRRPTNDEVTLFLRFMYDIYSCIDHQKNNNISDEELHKEIMSYQNKSLAKFIYQLIQKIGMYKEEAGYRDFTDQIIHTLDFFKKNRAAIPKFDHILIDEYQDVNDTQIELIDILSPKNLFVVGDPRQSIYGWRGSKVSHILDFSKKFDDAKVLQLTKNYRSKNQIVSLTNSVIKPMRMPDLMSNGEGEDADNESVILVSHDNRDRQLTFVAESILSQNIPRNEVFILARTNKELDDMERILRQADIRYLKRTTELSKKNKDPEEEEVTLATIHAIKGLEAELVYLIGANTLSFPCMVSDHPIMGLVKFDSHYDKFDEELRVFYVALSRAKTKLIINYTGTLTKFLDYRSKKIIQKKIDLQNKVKWKLNKQYRK
ncbi:MAG: UvrD-helicase domain-containing protein [Nanoarchaeota archaeon]|nr:UvrD-helicase domain-containing protein [Nanoarchaeota archaeon]